MDVPDLDAPTEVPSINASTAELSAFLFQVFRRERRTR
jgi:hypothetical protein